MAALFMSANPVDFEFFYDLFLTENGHKLPADVVWQPGMVEAEAALAGVSVSARIIQHSLVDKFPQNSALIFLNTQAANLAAASVTA